MRKFKKIMGMILVFTLMVIGSSNIKAYAVESNVFDGVTVTNLKVDKKIVVPGDTVKLSFQIANFNGDLPQVITGYIKPMSEVPEMLTLDYNANNNTYEVYVNVPQDADAGIWTLLSISLIDASGNNRTIFSDITGEPDSEDLSMGDFIIRGKYKVTSSIGSDRYDTAVKLSESQFTNANTVVIANGLALADGLGATPLATYTNASLLLSDKDYLPEVTKNEIKRLGATNAIIVGGTGVVTDTVTQQLKSLGITNVTRLGGIDRYETSLEIVKYIDANYYDVANIVISNGYGEADALSIAAVAGRDNMPIILVEKDKVPENVYNWLKGEAIDDAYIIGGTGVVSDNVLNKIDGITASDVTQNRLGGKDRYATNALVIENFFAPSFDKVYIAKGWELVDALAAGPVAALNGAPVVLSDYDLTTEQKNVLGYRYANTIIITGGGIKDKALYSLEACLQK